MSMATLRRYTQLAPLMHLMHRRALTLLNPSRWDDKNDAYYLEVYRRRQKLASVLALCFADSPETYHHWQIFAGPSGVCLEFQKELLVNSVCRTAGVKCDSVDYPLLSKLRKAPPRTAELPFVKRYPYKDEREFRIIFEHADTMLEAQDVPFEPRALTKITINPWMPRAVFESVRTLLGRIDGWGHVEIATTTLINNDEWKSFAGVVQPAPPRDAARSAKRPIPRPR